MPQGPQVVSFKGGLNNATDFLSMIPGQCMNFSDVQLNYGILQGRNPIHPISGDNGHYNGGYPAVWSWQDGSNLGTYIYVVGGVGSGGDIFRSSAVWTETMLTSPNSFSKVTGTLVPGASPLVTDVLNGLLVIVATSGSMTPGYYTSNTANGAVLPGSPPGNAVACKAVNNFMFMIQGSTIYWSAISDPTTWPAANFLTFQTVDGDNCTALGAIGTDLIVFKIKNVGKLSTNTLSVAGTSTLGPFVTIFNSLGCATGSAVDNLDDGTLCFWDPGGEIYTTDGYTFERLANPPPPAPNVYNTTKGLNQPSVYLRYYPTRREIWISDLINNFIMAYDITQGYWRVVSGATFSALGILRVPQLYSGASHNNFMLGTDSANHTALCMDDYLNNSGAIVDSSGNTVTGIAATSIMIPSNITQSGIYGSSVLYAPANSTRATMTIGYDGTYSSTVVTLSGASKYRWDLNSTSFALANDQKPASIQFKFQTTQCLDKFYGVFIDMNLGD